MIPLEKAVIEAKDKKPPFAYYYLRITQEDGHMAWSSPIGSTTSPSPHFQKCKAKSLLSLKSAPKQELLIEDFEEEEEDDDEDFDDEE